jgi:murein DD-endopeptidase MepM/ murein hydrolase activator NlpD
MGFGADVRSPADGVVVTVHDRERDHWSRMGWLALPFLVVESAARELTGPGRILGNHVVLDLGGGDDAALAHLQRRSVRVRPGDVVRAGTVIASCGNSGNSSEPHLHLQVMDHPRAALADGIPFTFAGAGLPRNGELLVAPE